MKAGLVVNLIEAHSSGNENLFEQALQALIKDEEKKGNSAMAFSFKKAYSLDKKRNTALFDSPMSSMTFSSQNITAIPKDKDSTLDLIDIVHSKVKLTDVALPDKTKDVLKQIIDEQKESSGLIEKGIIPTNRILFCGPPGCGKTLSANALAGELGIPIAYVKLDGLVSSYLGQTGTNIRKIFEFVKNKRMILFLDEFDAIAKKRDDTHELGELKRVVTTLLQNLDTLPSSVFLIAATNHHHLLDPAIWRRFDISILLELPNQPQRTEIINKYINEHLHKYLFDENILSVLTENMSGAQISSFMQSLAKHFIINKINPENVSIDIIASVWLKYTTLFISEGSEGYIKALSELSKSGIPMRTLEKITGIPKSTLSYRFNKEVKLDGKEETTSLDS